MSLNVYLSEHGDEVYSANITHNLTPMADAAGIYGAVWRPDENGITYAAQLIPLLTEGLRVLGMDRDRFCALNPENGWGSYEGLVKFIAHYVVACIEHPGAEVRVSR